MFPSASPRGTLRVSGKQNSLFPLGPVIKCLLFQSHRYGLYYVVDCHQGGVTGTPGPPGYAPVKCNRVSINVLFSFYLASKGSKKRFNTDEHNASNAG